MKNRIQLVLAVGVMAAACPTIALGAVVSYDFDMEFSGGSRPAGVPPWLNATFDDGDSAGSVTLTLTAINLTTTEFVSDWLFNLDPRLDPTGLTFALSGTPATNGFSDPNVSANVDSYKADGDGEYDIEIAFDVSDGSSTRFDAGDVAVFTIGGFSSLTANSFNYLSTPAGGHGPYVTAAHVQGIGEYSGWVTHLRPIPEPGTLSLLILGACLPLLRRRR